jgi:hypothetical protein
VPGPLRIRLTLDEGLADYVRAYAKVGLQGPDIRETIIWCIRSHIIDLIEKQFWREAFEPHLNKPYNVKRKR